MIDDAFDEVERAPTGEKEPDVRPPWWGKFSPLPRPDRENRTDEDDDPRRDVEETVGEHVVFQPTDGGGGVLSGGGEHVVPLENLVEHDSIQEPAEPNTEKEAR